MVLAIGDNTAARLVFASSKCDHITPLLRQLHWLKVPWRIDCKLAVLVFMVWHRHTSLTNFTIQQSQSFEGVCVPLRLLNCLFPVPTSQPTATERFQSPLYRSGTVFRSIPHLLRHFLDSGHVNRSNLLTYLLVCAVCWRQLSFLYWLFWGFWTVFKLSDMWTKSTTSLSSPSLLSPISLLPLASTLPFLLHREAAPLNLEQMWGSAVSSTSGTRNHL